MPAPAPAVPAWGARAEPAGDKPSRPPSLGEIQRAEEERAQRERAQRQRETARSGTTSASARTWANAIAPTKSFDQIQKEEASKAPAQSSAPSNRAGHTAASRVSQPQLMSAAVANGVAYSHSVSGGAAAAKSSSAQQTTQQQSQAKAPAAPAPAAPKPAPQPAPKAAPVVPEVPTNEQQLIDWCAQITMGLNSRTYLDIPTVGGVAVPRCIVKSDKFTQLSVSSATHRWCRS